MAATDGLLQFEESLLAHQIQNSDEPEAAAAAEEADSDGEAFLLKDDGNDIELRWAPIYVHKLYK